MPFNVLLEDKLARPTTTLVLIDNTYNFDLPFMSQAFRLTEFSLEKTKKLVEIRAQFLNNLLAQTPSSFASYYDFLLVAKQIGLRFQQAKHLMSLKSYFLQNNNSIQKEKLSSLLMVKPTQLKGKYIVRFALPHHMSVLPPILEEDQTQNSDCGESTKRKKEVLLDIKMYQLKRSLPVILKYKDSNREQIQRQLRLESLRVTDEDIDTIISCMNYSSTLQPEMFLSRLREIYYSKIDETVLKTIVLVQKKSGAQLYQSLVPNNVEMSIEEEIVKQRVDNKPLRPRFGPLKVRQKEGNQEFITKSGAQSNQNIAAHKQKIDKLLRSKRKALRRDNDTNSNRLKKLFVQNVVLPKQKIYQDISFRPEPKPTLSLYIGSKRVM